MPALDDMAEAKRDEVPLQEPVGIVVVGTQALRAFTADQLREYGRQCAQAAAQGMPEDEELLRRALAALQQSMGMLCEPAYRQVMGGRDNALAMLVIKDLNARLRSQNLIAKE